MSKLAEIQAAVESLSLEEMNAFEQWWHSQPGKPGASSKSSYQTPGRASPRCRGR